MSKLENAALKIVKKLYKNSLKNIVIYSLILLVVWSILKLFLLSYEHWLEPTIFADSFSLLRQGGDETSLLSWLFAQYNEHRIIFAKLSGLIEVNIFNLSLGQSALFQNFLLVLLSCGIWTKINQKLFKHKNLKIVTTLSGITLILHPWQWRNFNWEFQTPWFLINSLVLLSTFLLICNLKGNYYKTKILNLILIIIPWVAIYSTGSGIALGIALSSASFLKNKNLGIKVSISTIISLFSYFYILNYTNPHKELGYNFDFKFFFAILFGGIWHGLFLLILISLLALFIFKPRINRKLLAPLSLPILFSLFFAFIVTLSRSSMGINLAGRFEYTTHTLMSGLAGILLLGIIAKKNNDQVNYPFIGVVSLLITYGGFPQTLIFKPQHPNFRGYTFLKMWNHMEKDKKKIKDNFLCIADTAAFKIKNINLDCETSPLLKSHGLDYFLNNLNVKPNGWHKLHSVVSLDEKINQIFLKFEIEDSLYLSTPNIRIKGFAYAFSKLRGPERFFIVANYESSHKEVISYINNIIPINNKKIQVNELKKSFDSIIPLYSDGFALKNISIETRNSSKIIFKNTQIKN